jgi:hypothetical protein
VDRQGAARSALGSLRTWWNDTATPRSGQHPTSLDTDRYALAIPSDGPAWLQEIGVSTFSTREAPMISDAHRNGARLLPALVIATVVGSFLTACSAPSSSTGLRGRNVTHKVGRRIPVTTQTTTATATTAGPPSVAAGATPSTTTITATTTQALPVLIAAEPNGQQTWTGREPTNTDFSADAGNIVTDITWSSWTATQAVGQGTWTYQNCVPDCASCSQTPYPATIALADPVNGVFTSMTETTTGPEAFTTTYSYPSNWVQNAS